MKVENIDMKEDIYSVITGTGNYIPSQSIKNEDFLSNEFFEANGTKIDKTNKEIIDKFQEITTISERRYASEDIVASDMAYYAGLDAINKANIDKEELDYIIVAHNFGDVKHDNNRSDFVPSLAARVKHKLGINNPFTVAYDVAFGCPGWLQALIQADYYIRSGDAKKALVIGAETLSRVSDPHDRDSMIYADGAGATILEAKNSNKPVGILAHKSRSDALIHSQMLYMDKSYKANGHGNEIFLKMNGRKLYQYALNTVPKAIQSCLEKCNTDLTEVKKVLIHQANGKMDDAIIKRLFSLYNINVVPEGIMPMTIARLGNSSVATLPTLLDLIVNAKMDTHQIGNGDKIVFASVGAGMNINTMVYKMI